MTDILTKLDDTLLGIFPNEGIKFFGLCDLVIKSDQVHPVTIEGKEQVAINDRWDAIVFHRLGSGTFNPSDEQAFGRKTGKKLSQQVRTVVCVKAKKGEDWIFTFTEAIPETLTVVDYEFINIEEINLITDQVSVHNTEFGETNYEKHIQTWNIYALEYAIEFDKC